jgi:hypothetical protein
MSIKTAMVTGASEGIGRVFARRLAGEGYRVTAVARTESKLQALISELGEGHRYLVADLSRDEDIERIAEALGQEHYDLLVNNAGVGAYGAFQEADLSAVRRMMRLNCDAPLMLAQAFLRQAKSGDALINVSSMLALVGFPSAATYSATKAFLLNWSESLWYEQKARGVYVMALCPGITSTNFHDASGGTDQNRPPENMAQTPEEVVDEAIAALKARSQCTVIPGGRNRTMAFVSSRVMSRKRAISMMGGFSQPH